MHPACSQIEWFPTYPFHTQPHIYTDAIICDAIKCNEIGYCMRKFKIQELNSQPDIEGREGYTLLIKDWRKSDEIDKVSRSSMDAFWYTAIEYGRNEIMEILYTIDNAAPTIPSLFNWAQNRINQLYLTPNIPTFHWLLSRLRTFSPSPYKYREVLVKAIELEDFDTLNYMYDNKPDNKNELPLPFHVETMLNGKQRLVPIDSLRLNYIEMLAIGGGINSNKLYNDIKARPNILRWFSERQWKAYVTMILHEISHPL
jgi:hypothetical protein